MMVTEVSRFDLQAPSRYRVGPTVRRSNQQRLFGWRSSSTRESEMIKDDQRALGRLAKHQSEVPAPDPGAGILERKQADRSIKDALEDDEVRETLGLHHRGKRP